MLAMLVRRPTGQHTTCNKPRTIPIGPGRRPAAPFNRPLTESLRDSANNPLCYVNHSREPPPYRCGLGARPGLRMSLMSEKKPDQMVTVFAGMEREATAQAREYFKPYQPSSPQIALMKNGELVKMFQRHDIEGKDPSVLAQELAASFNEHC